MLHVEPLHATPSSNPCQRSSVRRGKPLAIHWGWLATVTVAHTAGLFVLANIVPGEPASAVTANQPPVISVRLLTPPQADPLPVAPEAHEHPPAETPPGKSTPAAARPPRTPPPTLAPAPVSAVPVPTEVEAVHLDAPAPSDAPPAPQAATAAATSAPQREASVDAAYPNSAAPPYPRLSRRLGEEGRVVLRVRVLADGHAASVEVTESSGYPRLDATALEAVRRWRFVPARRGDSAIDSWLRVPIVFRLED